MTPHRGLEGTSGNNAAHSRQMHIATNGQGGGAVRLSLYVSVWANMRRSRHTLNMVYKGHL